MANIFRKRFVLGGDDTRLYGKEKRMDVFALREILKEIGFDYDEACDRAKKTYRQAYGGRSK